MKVYEALAKAFMAEGTTAVFGMMGDANIYWMNAIDKLGAELLAVRHEGAGLSMAEGLSRVSGQPGVCAVTSGPGVSQLATALLVASRARTPLVVFAGASDVGDDESPQRFNQERFAEACETGFVHVSSAEDAYESVREAFYRAKTESRPIMLNAPANVQQLPFDDDEEEYVPSSALLAGMRPYPDPAKIAEALDIISRSSKPVVIVGRGARASGAGPTVLQLAENCGALVATTLQVKTWLNEDEFHVGISGLYATRTAMELFQDADCVIAVGASLNKYTTEHGYLYPNATYIQIDSAPRVIMAGGRVADCYIHSDARTAIELLHEGLLSKGFHNPGYRTAEVKQALSTAFHDSAEYEIAPGTVDPREVCLTLDREMPADIGLVIGGGQNIYFTTMLMTRRRRLVLANQLFGCIGQGLVTAMGAVKASGNKPVFLMEGDSGFMMHLAEFETAVRYGMPLMAVIMNDECLGAEYYKSMAMGLNTGLTFVSTPDLGEVGRALGGRGSLVRAIPELEAAIAEFVADPAPTIVDVRFSTSVISIPYRRLHFGEDV